MSTTHESEVRRRLQAELAATPPTPGLATRALHQAAREKRRHRVLIAASAAASAAVLAVAVVAVSSSRTAPEPSVSPVEHASWGPWAADGRLHLGVDSVPLPDGETEVDLLLVGIPTGAVYSSTATGHVVLVRPGRPPQQIGQGATAAGLVSDPKTGWVAWVESGATDPPELVVYDTSGGAELGRQPLPTDGHRMEWLDEGTQPIAIEDGTVYYAAFDGDYEWEVGQSAPRMLSDPDVALVDRQAGVVVTRPAGDSNALVVQQPDPSAPPVVLRGLYWGRLSTDGRYFLSGGSFSRLHVYDASTGEQIELPLGKGLVSSAAVLGESGTVTLAVGRRPDPDPLGRTALGVDGPLDLLTCDLSTAACETSAEDVGDFVALANG